MLHGETFSPISWFVALGMRSEGNAPKNGDPTVGCSFKTPGNWVVLFKDFLEKNKVTTLGHLPQPPDLVSADFYPSSTEINTEVIALF